MQGSTIYGIDIIPDDLRACPGRASTCTPASAPPSGGRDAEMSSPAKLGGMFDQGAGRGLDRMTGGRMGGPPPRAGREGP